MRTTTLVLTLIALVAGATPVRPADSLPIVGITYDTGGGPALFGELARGICRSKHLFLLGEVSAGTQSVVVSGGLGRVLKESLWSVAAKGSFGLNHDGPVAGARLELAYFFALRGHVGVLVPLSAGGVGPTFTWGVGLGLPIIDFGLDDMSF